MSDSVTEFQQTCDKPYDRHTYAIVRKDGSKVRYADYEQMRYSWFVNNGLKQFSHVIVEDVNKGMK